MIAQHLNYKIINKIDHKYKYNTITKNYLNNKARLQNKIDNEFNRSYRFSV